MDLTTASANGAPVLLRFPREHPERGAAFPATRGQQSVAARCPAPAQRSWEVSRPPGTETFRCQVHR
jgi:hypothetical protein